MTPPNEQAELHRRDKSRVGGAPGADQLDLPDEEWHAAGKRSIKLDAPVSASQSGDTTLLIRF